MAGMSFLEVRSPDAPKMISIWLGVFFIGRSFVAKGEISEVVIQFFSQNPK